ncbi:MAG: sulfite exporter TauE/SafE family protein [Actinomyces sp.]|uniref:sulfite exporter TauE/SafE family protein n=1 Tax=Actinomyces sp. TaxID=29317 RepID=UPI0026DBBD7E|nr:sulfite exporter TauE/SafE family protein [Actinomyces sp.]MDO4243369.1 sulfite exporter TauE/SafE family protein [Actinomyces sp.]
MTDLLAALSVPGLTASLLALLMCAALLAGWVDAVVGGGGLVQVPALMLVPGLPATHALGTNKVSSVMGTTAAAGTYRRQVGFPAHVLSTSLLALGTAGCGALAATRMPTEVLRPVIAAALLAVLAVTVLKPDSFTGGGRRPGTGAPQDTLEPGPGGAAAPAAVPRRSVLMRCLALGAAIGVYDGMLGPGTGSFLLIGFILLVGLDTLTAVAMSKAVNLATNAGALAVFALLGAVQWRLGLLMGVANMVGGWLGARTASRFGPRFVRVVLVVVVLALLVRLLSQSLG